MSEPDTINGHPYDPAELKMLVKELQRCQARGDNLEVLRVMRELKKLDIDVHDAALEVMQQKGEQR